MISEKQFENILRKNPQLQKMNPHAKAKAASNKGDDRVTVNVNVGKEEIPDVPERKEGNVLLLMLAIMEPKIFVVGLLIIVGALMQGLSVLWPGVIIYLTYNILKNRR